MNIREISDVFKDTANQISAIKSYNFGWASDRVRSGNTEDYQELNEFPRVFFSVPTITGSDQTRKQDTYQVTIFFDDLLGYNNEGDADLTLQLDKWAALQEYANYFVQRLNKIKQSILPNYLFIPEAPSITFDSFTGLQRMITVQLSFTLVVPTNCEPVVSTLIECIANIITSSNLTASITRIIKLASTLQSSSSLSASALVSKLAESNLNTESSLAASIQLAKLPSSSLNAGGTLVGDAFITRLFAASLNGNGSIFANPLITKFAASSLNGGASLNASALVSKLPVSSLTGAGTLAAELTVTSSATLLLDLYPNAAAAYSLRKLRAAYAGSAIRVRRSSDNTEQDIGFVAEQLDTVSLLAFCGVGNGFVTTWYDQSENGRNATQATAANQPQIVSSGVVVLLNTKPTINFAGGSTVSMNFNQITLSNFTILWVSRKSAQGQTSIILAAGLNGTSYAGDDVDSRGCPNLIAGGSQIIYTFVNNTTSQPTGKLSQHLCYLNRRNTNQAVGQFNNLNNAYNNSIATNNFVAAGIANYGANYNYGGDLQEIIIYGSDKSADRTNISTNINTNYAIY
jgi:hypothetical protein